MSDEFIDSSVFVYLFDETDERKRGIADGLIESALRTRSADSISFQVVQETLNVVTRKLPVPMTTEDAHRLLEQVLAPLWRVSPSLVLYRRGSEVQARYRYGFYDLLIVAAALESGCSRLYSEDLHDGQQIEGLKVENPFRD